MKYAIFAFVAILILIAFAFLGRFFMVENIGQKNKIEDIKNQEIIINSPSANSKIKSPVKITGRALGNWFFEASFPVKIVDGNGTELGSGIATAKGEWMTEDFVPFEAQVSFNAGQAEKGEIIFKNDNPSGLSEFDKEFRLPVVFERQETMKIKAYFAKNSSDCNDVFPVEREILKTQSVGLEAIKQLLKGPTQSETNNGYFTSINSGVKINFLKIENGIAIIDFDDQLEFQVGGSCRVSSIRAQITETLKQFSTVKSVVISINGRTEDILQP